MKRCAALLYWLVFAPALWAQTVAPALVVKQEGGWVPLGLARLETQVRIFGSVAETTTTMTFRNPLPRVMEGDLYFPLPEGATISGYALDIGGVMVDGVAVEKHEARRVFEQVVRQGIDPGLVQWTAGNNFQTRVFPIPANGSRTVRVQYVSELVGGNDAPAYHLPLRLKEKLPEFSLRVEVVKPAAPPKVAKGELANFAFAKWRDSFVAETRLQQVKLAEDLVIALPAVVAQPVLVERAEDGQVYFAIQDVPRVPPAAAKGSPPKHVVLFWDASGSRGSSDRRREIALVRAYLERCVDRAGRGPMVDLVVLRNALARPQRFEPTRPGLAKLADELGRVSYDGGTQLGAIRPLPGGPKPDLYLLFSDGISTFGRGEPARLDAPLYICSADSGANHSFLHSLAMATGGRYFNLSRLNDADVVAAIGQPSWSFLSAAVSPGTAESLYPELPQPIAGRFLLAGKLTGDAGTVTINYGVKGGQSVSQTFRVARADAAGGSLLPRLWAQKKLAELMIFAKRHKPEITALGKQFGLVTPHTSLLVLDSIEQYVEHEIAPPRSLAAMREEYHRRIDTIEHQRRKQKADKLADVLRMWDERVKWWNTKFEYPADFKYKGDQAGIGGFGMGGGGGFFGAGAARPRTAPAMRFDRDHDSDRRPAAKGDGPAAAPALAPPPMHAAPSPADTRPASPAPAERLPIMYEIGEAGTARPAQLPSQATVNQPGIVIKPWEPDTPYLKDLRADQGKNPFAVYLKHRARYGASPAFFLDCADFFRAAGKLELALQVLSNIAELELEEAALLRVLGHRLAQIDQLDLAVQTFEQVLELRPEEPQACRDLALVLARRAERAANRAAARDYQRAIELLARVVLDRWDGRFPEIEVIALEELNQILPKAKARGVPGARLDPRLVKLLDVDVRIVMTWHADNTDIDLWVTEPSGEKAFYGHSRTTIGGLVSRDFTGGYGPEEYLVRRAARGLYKIEANYFGTRATRLLGPVTVQVDVFTHFGRPNQQRKSLTIRLTDARQTVRIGEIEF